MMQLEKVGRSAAGAVVGVGVVRPVVSSGDRDFPDDLSELVNRQCWPAQRSTTVCRETNIVGAAPVVNCLTRNSGGYARRSDSP